LWLAALILALIGLALGPTLILAAEPALPLPAVPSLPPGVDNSPNPLLDFDQTEMARHARMIEASEAHLPALSPFMPGETPPPGLPTPQIAPPQTPATPAQQALIALAEKVAGSVVSIRVWDQFGGLLSSGVGSFVSEDGLVLTDASLLHPEIAERIDYITTTAANGTNHRITGFYTADLRTGVALLQSEGPAPMALELQAETDFSKPRACRVVALSDTRGLLIADAQVAFDDTLAGQGWLALRGEDSPGGVGSPVLSEDGTILGIVAMKTPLESWMNFAVPAGWAAFELQKKRPPIKPLKELPRTPRLAQIAADADFIIAFSQIQSRSMSAATRTLLRLTKRYPRSAECWALLGISAGQLGAAPDALSCQRRAVALDPRSGVYWHQMAMAQIRSRSAQSDATSPADEAEEYGALVEATKHNPNDRLSWLLLATHHIKAGDLPAADECLQRLTFLAPAYAQGYYMLGYVKCRTRDYPAASAALSRCVAISGDLPNAWYLLGLIHDRQRNYREAIEAYRKTVRLLPNHPEAWMNLAHSLKKHGQATEAGQAFREHQRRVLSKTASQ
jgi:tetratricopeptide (TPR) repeat protein